MCPDAEILSAYFDGEIEPPWRARIEEHLRSCISCQRTVEEFGRLRSVLQEDQEPGYQGSFDHLRRRLAQRSSARHAWRLAWWERKVEMPLPLAAAALLALFLMAGALLLFAARPDYRRLSIRRGPSGTTEVQVAAPIEDLELLLKSLDKNVPKQEIIITLPEGSRFYMAGKPRVMREAEFSRKME